MTRLKIGILTFHRCINYGSYWQARCLAEGLQQRGHDVSILDHESRRVNIAEWKCAYQPVLPTPVPPSDYPLYRKKIEQFFAAFDTLPLSPRFLLDNPIDMEDYDLVVVGSDEVWNLTHPWYGQHPLFYGDGIRARHLISYAASFGNYSASWGLDPFWASKLQRFEKIAVRDENSRLLIKNALGIEPEMVLDPCLQFPIMPTSNLKESGSKPYVAVYGHNFSEYFIQNIRKWATEKQLPLISIGYRNDWVDEQWIMAGPLDFAHFIAGSEAVVTNFFHGCVFALVNAKPFACESYGYRNNKIQGLMAKLGGQKHLLTEATHVAFYEECLNNPIDSMILKRIDALRLSSNEYLDQALTLKKKAHETTVQP
jgi:polysaccharide pyruvyl transferase WcaK-like protein